jgi:hypothetical protein
MPHGFFTIEQWKPPSRGAKPAWVAVLHLDASQSLSDALQAIEARGQAGFFRVIQTQREVWAEKVNRKLVLRKWHAATPEELQGAADAFVRDRGVFNVAAAAKARARQKQAKKQRISEGEA